MQSGGASDAQEELGPIARMMMSVAAQAITGYVQFRALVELLIARGVISRDELENLFEQSRETQLQRTIDEWFPSDIAYHIKMAMQSAATDAAAYQDSAVPSDVDEIARARAMQGDGGAADSDGMGAASPEDQGSQARRGARPGLPPRHRSEGRDHRSERAGRSKGLG